MNFTLTIHAQERLQERELPIYLLQLLVESPEQVIEEEGVKIYQSRFYHNDKVQLLRAVVDDSVYPVVVNYPHKPLRRYGGGLKELC